MEIEENLSSFSMFFYTNLQKIYKIRIKNFKFKDYKFIEENGLHHIVLLKKNK
jgi:hypothetical protein